MKNTLARFTREPERPRYVDTTDAAEVRQLMELCRPYINRERAMACTECPAIYTADGGPCPACASPHAFPLARWMNREPEAKGCA